MCIPYSHYYISLDSNYCYRLIAHVTILWDAVDDFSHAFDSSARFGSALVRFASVIPPGHFPLLPLLQLAPSPRQRRAPSVNARTCLMIRKWFPAWFHHTSAPTSLPQHHLPPSSSQLETRMWLKFYANLPAPNWLCKNSPNETKVCHGLYRIPYSVFPISYSARNRSLCNFHTQPRHCWVIQIESLANNLHIELFQYGKLLDLCQEPGNTRTC